VAELEGSFNGQTDTLILDGIPRNLQQAQMLKGLLQVRAVIYLWGTDMKKLVARLQRRALRENRLDDANIEIIRQRLETYERETHPVLDFYGPKLVFRIDSTQSPITVLREILNALANSAP
jgi:adenylate kinase